MDNIATPIFSKLNPALLSVPQELTVAAANFNLDFSLMKVEAPKEFLGVGDALSAQRRGDAEEGQIHITARKLGALFEALAPPVPHLYQAYGKRASAISKRANTEPHKGINTGIFSHQVGPDGASIWAAATSGTGAIAIHLLACMLARILKTAEAISVWVELVEHRKQQINDSAIESIATLMASKQSFSRQQLASWDASARSWLQTADADRRVQQTQLMLIINNVRLPVNSKTDTYGSVLEAWKSGMIAMDRLAQGIPQQVQEGAILLAMSSWHLYPNMQVLLEEIKDIEQHDELMAGALLTIPAYGAVHNKEGVFWSLPLAKMRYYSAPVVVERQLASTTSRITIQELWIIVLGIFFSQWQSFCPSIERLCGIIIQLSTLVNQPRITIKWLKFLEDAAQEFMNCSDLDRSQSKKLLRLGMRWCSAFLNSAQKNTPNLFGLDQFSTLLSFIKPMEEKISILREIATTLRAEPQDLLIRYQRTHCQACYPCVSSEGPECACAQAGVICTMACHLNKDGLVACNSSRVVLESIGKESREGHRCPQDELCPGCFLPSLSKAIEQTGERCAIVQSDEVICIDDWSFKLEPRSFDGEPVYTILLGDVDDVAIYAAAGAKIKRGSMTAFGSNAKIDEVQRFLSSPSLNIEALQSYLGSWWDGVSGGTGYNQQKCSLQALTFVTELYGTLKGATVSIEVAEKPLYEALWAQWVSRSSEQKTSTSRRDSVSLESPLSAKIIVPPSWGFEFEESRSSYGESPTEVSYGENPTEEKVVHDSENRLAATFACLAMLETGELNIDPRILRGVLALSHGDSIYVRSDMISDPHDHDGMSSHPIRRVFGNLGRSGMAFLLPPSEPKLGGFDISSWRLINHHPFDGKLEDRFRGTSLHLSFTDFELPIDVGSRGLRDRLVCLLECVVSANDQGNHIGDLDINAIFRNDSLVMAPKCTHEKDSTSPAGEEAGKSEQKQELVAIDSWAEFFDLPDTAGIFRAKGNWQARLAAATASMQQGNKAILLPRQACLECLETIDASQFDLIIA
ncbi:hypothetical protein GRF29_44g966898 [Pseudopithomyces chartarum]|uniref:Uncharacterized protein n=1 Tax=Pseudopithomyces chartarum TaxID=1892770 RepID=A0AAN6RJ40_9PLEO|nr:hypothetical protein GRF29_44g966898 [Pseudopithomyces chartarum]